MRIPRTRKGRGVVATLGALGLGVLLAQCGCPSWGCADVVRVTFDPPLTLPVAYRVDVEWDGGSQHCEVDLGQSGPTAPTPVCYGPMLGLSEGESGWQIDYVETNSGRPDSVTITVSADGVETQQIIEDLSYQEYTEDACGQACSEALAMFGPALDP